MADEPNTSADSPESQEQTEAVATKSSLFGKIKILLFVILVVLLECGAVYWYLPAATESAILASTPVNAKEEDKAKPEKETEKEANDQVEVDLGDFNVTAYQPVSNTTLRIDFHLYGTVAALDQKDFTSRMEENKHRFRDQIIITMRSSEISDLTDAGLGLIKRKIMDKTNRMLGKPFLKAIIFSDFSFIEQ